MGTKRCVRVWVVAVAMIAMCVVVTTPVFPATLYNDAVSYWKFDETSGANANDEKPANNDGTLTNFNFSGHSNWTTSGKVGGALNFDGSNDYVNIPASASLKGKTAASIGLWYKSDQIPPLSNTGLYYESTMNDGYSRFGIFHMTDGRIAAVARDTNTGTAYSIYSNSSITLNSWHYLAATYDSTTDVMALYIDDALPKTNTATKGPFTTEDPVSPITVGAFKMAGASYYINGIIDEVAVWNTALSGAQIDALYKTGFISSSMSALSLNYTTDQINQLAYLYLNQAGPVTIGDSVWSYVAHNDPIWDGHRTVGATFNVGGVNYLYLGGGISQGPLGGGVPEPSSMAVSGLAIGLLGLIKRMRRKEDKRQESRD